MHISIKRNLLYSSIVIFYGDDGGNDCAKNKYDDDVHFRPLQTNISTF